MHLINFICKIRLKFLLGLLVLNILIVVLIYFQFGDEYNDQNLPTLIWWTPFMWETQKIISCQKHKCVVTTNRNSTSTNPISAILFYGSALHFDDLPLPRNQSIHWAIYHEESPKNLPFFNYVEGQKLFNITATFSRLSHVPLTFLHLKDINMLTDTTYFKPLNIKNSLLNDIAPILYIQRDCDTPIQRDSYVSELMKYINVDSYGECLNNRQLDEKFVVNRTYNLYEENFMHFVSQYKFILAIENAACYDYVTEKFWRPLIVGSIPIYLGSPVIQDWLPNNKSAILIEQFKSPKDVANYINLLNNNDRLYNEYLDHKLKGEVGNKRLLDHFRTGYYNTNEYFEDTIEAFECFVCDNSFRNNIVETNVYNCSVPSEDNNWHYHWKIGKCQARVLHDLILASKVDYIPQQVFDNLTYEYLRKSKCD